MAPRKRASEAYESDDGFVEDAAPTSKRAKTKASSSKASRPFSKPNGTSVDEDGNEYWELNEKGSRRVTINKFGGRWMVNIREYFQKDDKWLPGKKGISLTMDQYEAFIGALPAIESALSSKGESVSRPQYGGAPDKSMDEADTAGDGDGDIEKDEVKKNYETTSEEEP